MVKNQVFRVLDYGYGSVFVYPTYIIPYATFVYICCFNGKSHFLHCT